MMWYLHMILYKTCIFCIKTIKELPRLFHCQVLWQMLRNFTSLSDQCHCLFARHCFIAQNQCQYTRHAGLRLFQHWIICHPKKQVWPLGFTGWRALCVCVKIPHILTLLCLSVDVEILESKKKFRLFRAHRDYFHF